MKSIRTFIVIMGHAFSICPGIIPVDVFSELSDLGVTCSKYGVYKGEHRQQKVRQKSSLCGFEDLPDEEIENGGDNVAAGDSFTNANALECLPEPSSIVNEYEFPRTFSGSLHAFKSFEKVPRHDNGLKNNGGMKSSENIKSNVLTPISINTFEMVQAISEIQRPDGALWTSSSSADVSVDMSPAHDVPPVFLVSSNLEKDVIHCKAIHCLSIDGETASQNKNFGAVMSHDENPIRPLQGIFFLGPEDTEDRSCAYVENDISEKLGYVRHSHQPSRDCFHSRSVSDRLSSDMISTTCARLSPFRVPEHSGQDGVHALCCAGNLQSRLSNTIQRCWTTCEVFFMSFYQISLPCGDYFILSSLCAVPQVIFLLTFFRKRYFISLSKHP